MHVGLQGKEEARWNPSLRTKWGQKLGMRAQHLARVAAGLLCAWARQSAKTHSEVGGCRQALLPLLEKERVPTFCFALLPFLVRKHRTSLFFIFSCTGIFSYPPAL